MNGSNPVDVELRETNLFGQYLYRLYVDGEKYDQFFSRTPLSWSDQNDVASYYREALTTP